jgi:hypothetical protein
MEFHDPAKVHIQRPVLSKLGSVFKQGDIVSHITAVVSPQKRKGDFDLDGPTSDSTAPIDNASPARTAHMPLPNGHIEVVGVVSIDNDNNNNNNNVLEMLPPPQRVEVDIHIGTPTRRLSSEAAMNH